MTEETISRLNNEAAYSIVNKQYDHSIELLREATILIKNALMALPPLTSGAVICKQDVQQDEMMMDASSDSSSSSPNLEENEEANIDFYCNGDNFCKFILSHDNDSSSPSVSSIKGFKSKKLDCRLRFPPNTPSSKA